MIQKSKNPAPLGADRARVKFDSWAASNNPEKIISATELQYALYGLALLSMRPNALVVVCGRAEAADAAERIFPDCVAVASPDSPHPSEVDWTPLGGRKVLFWPAVGEAGKKHAQDVALILHGLGCEVSIVDAAALASVDPETGEKREPPVGWDATNALAECLNHLDPVRNDVGRCAKRLEPKPDEFYDDAEYQRGEITMSEYPPDFKDWPQEMRNQFFADEARRYQEREAILNSPASIEGSSLNASTPRNGAGEQQAICQPFVPREVDLRDFPFMQLDVRRLRDCEFAAKSSADGFRAAILLWCAAWHQVPASSLPKDDVLLAQLAGYGRDLDGFSALRDEALYGFEECSDGRLYHRVIAEKAAAAWEKKLAQRKRAKAGANARWPRHKSGETMPEAMPGASQGASHRAVPQAVPVASSKHSTSNAQKCQGRGREREIGNMGSPVREPMGTSTPREPYSLVHVDDLDSAFEGSVDPLDEENDSGHWSVRL